MKKAGWFPSRMKVSCHFTRHLWRFISWKNALFRGFFYHHNQLKSAWCSQIHPHQLQMETLNFRAVRVFVIYILEGEITKILWCMYIQIYTLEVQADHFLNGISLMTIVLGKLYKSANSGKCHCYGLWLPVYMYLYTHIAVSNQVEERK